MGRVWFERLAPGLILLLMIILTIQTPQVTYAYKYATFPRVAIFMEPGDEIIVEGFIKHGGIVSASNGKACAIVSFLLVQVQTERKLIYSYTNDFLSIGATQGLYYRTAVPDLLRFNWSGTHVSIPHLAFGKVIATKHDKIIEKIQQYGIQETYIRVEVHVGDTPVDYYDDVAKFPVYPIHISYTIKGQGWEKSGTLTRYMIDYLGRVDYNYIFTAMIGEMLSGNSRAECRKQGLLAWYNLTVNGVEVPLSKTIVTIENPPDVLVVRQGEVSKHTMIVRSQYKMLNYMQLTIATQNGIYKITKTPVYPWGPSGPAVYISSDSDLDLRDKIAKITIVVDARNAAPGEYHGNIDYFVYGVKVLTADVVYDDSLIDSMLFGANMQENHDMLKLAGLGLLLLLLAFLAIMVRG